MFWIDASHPVMKRAVNKALFAWLQDGLDSGKTGTEQVYISLKGKFYTVDWDKLRAKYGRKPATDTAVASDEYMDMNMETVAA